MKNKNKRTAEIKVKHPIPTFWHDSTFYSSIRASLERSNKGSHSKFKTTILVMSLSKTIFWQ